MKAVFGLAILFASVFAQAKPALHSYDCNTGNDGMGGYYCHYNISACTMPTCEEAIQCVVKKIHKEIEGKAVTVSINKSKAVEVTVPDEDDVQTRVLVQSRYANCTGSKCTTKMFVQTATVPAAHLFKVGQCEPKVITILGR